MTPALRRLILDSPGFNPYLLPDTAARYDFTRQSSLIYDGSNRTALAGDLSGNSNVNVLALNGVAGNYASAPHSAALDVSGDLDLRIDQAANDYTPAAAQILMAKDGGAPNRSWIFRIDVGGGLAVQVTTDGSTLITKTSTVSTTLGDLSRRWLRVVVDVDNGAGGWDVLFYTSPDGQSWTQLGATVTTATPITLFTGTGQLEIGSNNGGANRYSGLIYRAQIYSGIAGTLVFDANFSTFTKLAATGAESSANAATVTINSSGDTGARICGARDYCNMTVANQLVRQATGGLLANGTAQYFKTPPFALPQPVSRYLVVNMKTWTSGDYICDGAGANTCALIQTSASPQINISAGSSVAANTDLAVDKLAVVTLIINGASSFLRINLRPATTGNAGAGVPNGLTLAASGTPGNYGNELVMEEIVRSVVDPVSLQDRNILFLMRKYRIAS